MVDAEQVVVCPLCKRLPFVGKMNGEQAPVTYECSDLSGDCPMSVALFTKEQWDKFAPLSWDYVECASCGKTIHLET